MINSTFQDTVYTSPYVYIIGVAGDSGSGKTTFTSAIVNIFGSDLVSTITLDDYHIYDREERARLGVTPLSPKANDLDRLARDIALLKQGKPIQKPVYSHDKGTIEEPVLFHPNRFIILEGLHPFATKTLLQHIDYTIFVDPDNDVKYEWKLRRDVSGRNYQPEEVLKEIQVRQTDYEHFVLPQRKVANTIIRIGYSEYGPALGSTRNVYRIVLAMKPPETCLDDIELNIDLCSLFARSSHDFRIECTSTDIDERRMRSLIVDGELMHETIRKIELNIEAQTGIHPINLFSGKEVISGSDLARLIISWQIINHWILTNIRHTRKTDGGESITNSHTTNV
ncbi:MAG TPA: phosphoribulokinase [Methanospirillum sp.]|nr:phosphoribulokinase [Methanospirillum sp.]